MIAVVDGTPAVIGYSSGARLALEAAAAGLPMTKIALYEPPIRPGETNTFDPVVATLDRFARYTTDMINNASLGRRPGGANHQLEVATTGAALRAFLT